MKFENEIIDEQLVDLTILKRSTNNNEAIIKKVILLFINEMPIQLVQLEQSLQKQKFKKVSKIAHQIKPSIDHLANKQMQTLIRKIEGKKGELSNNISPYTIDFCKKSYQLLEQLKRTL